MNFIFGLLEGNKFLSFSVKIYNIGFDKDSCYSIIKIEVLEEKRFDLSSFIFFKKLLKVFFKDIWEIKIDFLFFISNLLDLSVKGKYVEDNEKCLVVLEVR